MTYFDGGAVGKGSRQESLDLVANVDCCKILLAPHQLIDCITPPRGDPALWEVRRDIIFSKWLPLILRKPSCLLAFSHIVLEVSLSR